MKNIKLFAVDIDGVILEDTFSPVLRNLIIKYGGTYSDDIERNVFSRNQKQAASYIINKLGLTISEEELISEYFIERDIHLESNDGGLRSGALDMLNIFSSFNIPMICYGGLNRHQIHNDFDQCDDFFDEYICTNDFRPGMLEIINKYKLNPEQVLFIDDVNTVAEKCSSLGTAFIGVPPLHSWGWQKKAMMETGVAFTLNSIKDFTKELLIEVDNDISKCFKSTAIY